MLASSSISSLASRIKVECRIMRLFLMIGFLSLLKGVVRAPGGELRIQQLDFLHYPGHHGNIFHSNESSDSYKGLQEQCRSSKLSTLAAP